MSEYGVIPENRILDSAANPVPDGQLHVFLENTTSYAALFADEIFAVPVANPQIADGAGFIDPFFVKSEGLKYRKTLADGTTIVGKEVDNVASFVTSATTVLNYTELRAINSVANGSYQVTSQNIAGIFIDIGVGSASLDDGGIVIATNNGRLVKRLFYDAVTPLWYEAAVDGVTSDVIPFQKAIDYLLSVGGGVFNVPVGTAWFPAGAKLDPGAGDIEFIGSGWDSIMKYHEGTVVPAFNGVDHLFRNTLNIPKGKLTFRDMQIQGTLDGGARGGRWANPMWLDYYPKVSIDNVKFFNVAGEGMDFHFGQNFICKNCWFENIAADPIRVRDTPNCNIKDNYILRCGDDSIAIHTSDGSATGTREGVVVAGNHVVSGGTIKVLGGRSTHINNNRIELGNLVGIQVSDSPAASVEGNIPMRDMVITGNIILDTLSITGPVPAITHSGIALSGPVMKGTATTNGIVPGFYDTTNSNWIYPWDWDEVDTIDVASAVGATNGVVVSNNIIRRTRPAVAAFSDYGVGTRLWQGEAFDPAITDAHLRLNSAIAIPKGGFRGAIFSENIVEHCLNFMSMEAMSAHDYYSQVLITGNQVSDCIHRGIVITGAGPGSQDIVIENNSFDLDPYRLGSNSNIDGTYDADALPRGIDIANMKGVTVRGNRFKNTCKVIQTNVASFTTVAGNTLICEPINAASGFHTSNKGIGIIERAGPRYRYEIRNSDPTSPSYENLTLVQADTSVAMPTSGYYAEGAFVAKTTLAVVSNRVVSGWLRLTFGTGHVLGTDWILVQYSNLT